MTERKTLGEEIKAAVADRQDDPTATNRFLDLLEKEGLLYHDPECPGYATVTKAGELIVSFLGVMVPQRALDDLVIRRDAIRMMGEMTGHPVITKDYGKDRP